MIRQLVTLGLFLVACRAECDADSATCAANEEDQTKSPAMMQVRSKPATSSHELSGHADAKIHADFDGLQGKQENDDGGVEDCESDIGEVHTFTVDGETRCFNLITPESAQKPMPVVVFFHGKGGRANAMCKSNTELAQSAESMGFALLCGDAFVDWQFPKVDGVEGVSSDNPQPCSSDDTPEVDYMQKVLETVQSDGKKYDSEKIYFQGFSQGAMMTSWASTCFADQIRGASQAGSGLKLAKEAVTEEWCAGSSSTRCSVGATDGNNIPGGSCPDSSSCEYFPIKTTNKKNVIGEDLKWCLFAGCSDYLLGSVLSQDQHLTAEGVPHDLVFYDGPHQAPTNWMPQVAKCHGWGNVPELDEPMLDSCDGIDLGTNEGKYCLGETGCGGSGSGGGGGDGGGGGGGSGGGGSGGGNGGGGECPGFCNEDRCGNSHCSEKCEFCSGGGSGGGGGGGGEGSGNDGNGGAGGCPGFCNEDRCGNPHCSEKCEFCEQ